MIRWPLFLVVTTWLQLLDGVLAMSMTWAPSLHACLVVYVGLNCRISTVPGLLFITALARAPWIGGDLWSQVMGLALIGCALVPQRRLFFRGGSLYLTLLGALVAAALSGLDMIWSGWRGHGEVGGFGWQGLLATTLVSAPVLAVLPRLPPFMSFGEMDPV